MMYYEHKFPVRYYETDQMGVVHHSNYIRYFETARMQMLVDAGYPITECEEEGVTMPVVSLSCKYHYPARMGDMLKVVCTIDSVPMAKITIKSYVYNTADQLCASGEVVVGFLNKVTNRPTRCPEKLMKIIESRQSDVIE